MKWLVYPDGAADQTVPVVDLEDPFKQLVSGRLVRRHLTLQKVDRLGHAPGEVHQGVGRVPSVQSLVAAVDPAGAGQEGKGTASVVCVRHDSRRQSGPAYWPARTLTWRRPSPPGRSRTRCCRWSDNRPAGCRQSVACRQSPRPPTRRSARSESGKSRRTNLASPCPTPAPSSRG